LIPVDLIELVERIVADLAAGRFDLLGHDGRAGRCKPEDLRREIARYGRTLVPLPEGWVRFTSLYGPEGARSLDVDLWTEEEGRSDLTLQLEIRLDEAGAPIVAIQDLHVL
jgi:hypothetical protein